jgi:hypothetical protein
MTKYFSVFASYPSLDGQMNLPWYYRGSFFCIKSDKGQG